MPDNKSGQPMEWGHTIFPRCPYCGKDEPDWWDCTENLQFDGDSTEFTCGRCEREYSVTIHRDIEFTTGPAKAAIDKEG